MCDESVGENIFLRLWGLRSVGGDCFVVLFYKKDFVDKFLLFGVIILFRLFCEVVVDEEEVLVFYGVFIVEVVSEIFFC